MKTFKVTLVAELQLPDDFDAQDDAVDGSILIQGDRAYMPIIQWLEAPLTLQPKATERAWDTVNDETAVQLIDSTQSEECGIDRVEN